MTRITMPDPAYRVETKYGNMTSYTSWNPRAKKHDGLYTEEQMDSYADARAREVLEQAIAIIEENADGTSWVTKHILMSQADAIRELIPGDS